MFEELLIRLAEGLDKRGLPYMIIRGQAVLLYGEPRLTRDIDITAEVIKILGLKDSQVLRIAQAVGPVK